MSVRRYLALAFACLVAFGALAANNTPPPVDQSNPALYTVNGLAGIGRTSGFVAAVGSGVQDLIATSFATNVPADATTLNATLLRKVVVTRIVADDETDAACVRLGPPAGDPSYSVITCPAVSTASGGATTGGCYLVNAGDTCSFVLRPQTSGCEGQFAFCVPRLEAVSSGAPGDDVLLNVALAW